MTNIRTLGGLIDARVIEVTNGFAFGGHSTDGSGVPHIRPFNVTTDGELSLEQIKSVPPDATTGKPHLHRGDIVFNNTNTKELVGKCAVWNHDSTPVFSNHMTRIRVSDDAYDPHFLSFAILHHWTTGKSAMLARAHVAQASIMGERFREIEVPWPSAAEQSSIARTIMRLRDACNADTAQAQHAQRLKQSTMGELFTRGLRGEMQKQVEIGMIPETWVISTIGAHHSVVSGGTPSRGDVSFWNGGTIPWVKTTEVDYCVITDTEEKITAAGLTGSAAKLLPPGTLLMAMYGQGVTRGRVAILAIAAACNQACAAITATDDTVLPRFLYHFLSWRYHAIRTMAHGGQQQNLNLDIVRDLPLAYPRSKDEQQEIVSILDAIDVKMELHRRKRDVLEELFKSLLHKLMTGELRVDQLDLAALDETKPEVA